jgi:putative tryptophan/tyrosine transport system substrate-binding protein
MRRRTFITLAGGVAAPTILWPLAAPAQQAAALRRVAVLMGWSESDPEYHLRVDALIQGLAQAGWAEGRNVRFDVRWTNGDAERAHTLAKELVTLQPDVIIAGATPATAALQRETRTIPIVFAVVSDPVGAGFVASLSRPGGNITGFINVESAMVGKQAEILKEIAPHLTRAAVMFNPDTAPGRGAYFLESFEAAAKSLAVQPVVARVHNNAEIEAAVASMAADRGGVVGMTDSFMSVHRGALISAAARENVPAILDLPNFPREGGLISYGPSSLDLFRRAVPYVDRILRGAKPADLPVQVPVQFELLVNLKTAKALGLAVPPALLARADEVIE